MKSTTFGELFDKVYTLPTDNVGIHELEHGYALHVYKTTGPQFNIIIKDLPAWNFIKNEDTVSIVPVINGVSQWERREVVSISDPVYGNLKYGPLNILMDAELVEVAY